MDQEREKSKKKVRGTREAILCNIWNANPLKLRKVFKTIIVLCSKEKSIIGARALLRHPRGGERLGWS